MPTSISDESQQCARARKLRAIYLDDNGGRPVIKTNAMSTRLQDACWSIRSSRLTNALHLPAVRRGPRGAASCHVGNVCDVMVKCRAPQVDRDCS